MGFQEKKTSKNFNPKNIFFVKSFNQIFTIFIFGLFLFPISYHLEKDFDFTGISINYLFLLYPLFLFFLNKKIYLPSLKIKLSIIFYLFLFFISFLLSSNLIFLREKIFSFIIFMSIFSYTFVKIDENLIKNFKLSLVFFSIIFFIIKLINYKINIEESFIDSNLDYINKGNFGSQREGFLYLMAIWITFYYQSRRFFLLFKYVIIIVLLSALLLTFSRASVAGFIFSIIFYLVFDFKNYIKKVKRYYIHIFIIICLIFVLYITFKTFYSKIIEFYFLRFVDFWNFLINFSFKIDYNDDTSENFRFLMFLDVIDTELINTIIGSGYLGVWTISENLIGSSHNQYLDILFRTGIFGLFIYLFIIYRVVIFLKNSHRSLYFGFIGVLFFGFFHETFKLSQGAFLLTFILGMCENKIIKDKFKFNQKLKKLKLNYR